MKYYSDGFIFGRNGIKTTGGGYTIIDEEGNVERKEVFLKNITNNHTELLGVLNALRECDYNDEISTDSKCIIAWVKKGKTKARPDLNELISEAHDLMHIKHVNLFWEPREENLAGIYNEEYEYTR